MHNFVNNLDKATDKVLLVDLYQVFTFKAKEEHRGDYGYKSRGGL